MAKADYPILLTAHLAERVWGGSYLGDGIGEAWDLSVHESGPCHIVNGPLAGATLAEVNADHVDDFGGPIRLLAKRLDAARDLSVQVHPKLGDPKTEAWIVLRAQAGAGVYHGFPTAVTRDEIRSAAQDGTLHDLMRFLEVQPGRCVFVPSGTVHAIGSGLFLFEIQQSSNTTYRLHDWGRGRELHVEPGVPCCDLDGAPAFPPPRPLPTGALRLVECEHFHVDRIDTHKPYRIDPAGTWRAFLVVAGYCRIGAVEATAGATVMIPNAAGEVLVEPSPACTLLIYGPSTRRRRA